MKTRRIPLLWAVVCLVALAGSVLAGSVEQAAQLSAEARALLAKGEFSGALKTYATAAKTDPDNQDYRQQYAILRRVLKMRKSIDKEQNPKKWSEAAQALRSFYYEHELYGEALSLDRARHEREKSAESAALLAETQLEMGLNAETTELLSGLAEDQATLQTQVLRAIALARENQASQAHTIAGGCQLPEKAGPGMVYDLARLRALVGDKVGALALLTRCFESTPPSRLVAFKEYAKRSPDLSTLVASAEFAQVLETKSKVAESSCSSGTSCGKCPSRTSCGSASSKSSSTKTDK